MFALVSTTTPCMSTMTTTTSLSGTVTRTPEALAPSDIEEPTFLFDREERREDTLDVAGLWLMSEEFFWLLV
jgi:hypothetical protein